MDALTSGSIKHIAKSPKFKGLQLLSHYLKIDSSTLDEDLRTAALLDYYYDVMQFAANRGMPWHEVARAVHFAADFFDSFIETNLTQALCSLRDLGSTYVEKKHVSLENMKKLVNYFTTTFLAHHKLYQYVFLQERECLTRHTSLCVQEPGVPCPLAGSKSYEIWMYEKQCSDVKQDEETREVLLQEEENKLAAETEECQKGLDAELKDHETLREVDLKSVEDLLSRFTANEVNIMQKDAAIKMEKLKNVADIAIALQSIEVPAVLKGSDVKLTSTTSMRKNSAWSEGSRRYSKKLS